MKQRILTGVLAAIVFLFLVIVGKLPFTILIYAMGSVALFELLRMKKLKLVSLPGLIGLLLLWMFLLPSQYSFFEADGISKMEIALFAVLLLLTYTVLVKNTFTFDEVGFITLAAIYIGMCFHYFIEIRNLDQYGLTYIFMRVLSFGPPIPVPILSVNRLGSRNCGLKSVRIKQWKGLQAELSSHLYWRRFFSLLHNFRSRISICC